ncbi:MAG: polysaccharide biosynthesis protein [Clostridia bacterium]|nr:polysaccharide biosynthesis protein [Clostridia bacterium]
MSEMKKQSFLQGAFVLVCANLLVKIIGAGFKLPLTYLIGEEGMGLFGSAYTVYTILFVIATAGFPIAISKMVSESVALGYHRQADRIFKVAFTMLLCVGTIGTAVLYFGAEAFAGFLKTPDAAGPIKAIAPAVFFVSVMSSLRGYFQGHQNMYPTAISEVTEAVGKLIFGYLLAYYFMNVSVAKAASGAIFGVTMGTVLGSVILVAIYLVKRFKEKSYSSSEPLRSVKSIAKELIKISVPITIGASVASITTLIDMATITRRLQSITQVTEEFMVKYGSLVDVTTFTGAIDSQLATKLYGLYNGYAVPLFNLPLTIVAAIAMSVVPAIAAAIAKKNYKVSNNVTKGAIKITILLALPCGVGLFVLAKPILITLYNNGLAETLLQSLSVAIVFVSLLSVTTAVLQAYGHPSVPMINMLIGGIVKIATNYYLVGTPKYNIDGAPIGTVICYFVIVMLNIICLIRITKIRFSVTDFVIKPLFCALVMAIPVLAGYKVAFNLGLGVRLSVVVAVALGVLVYGLLILFTGAIKKDDVLMLPKGESIYKLLTKTKLMK